MKQRTRWVSESEAQWAARLFAERGRIIVGSRYGKPRKRVTLAGVSSFQADRLKDRFGGSVAPDRWYCDGPTAAFFISQIKQHTTVEVVRQEDLPPVEGPRCHRPTRLGTPCQRVARRDLGLVSCWTHRSAE